MAKEFLTIKNFDSSTYIPPANTAVIYKSSDETEFWAKNSSGEVKEVSSPVLTLLKVSADQLPALVFAEDLAQAEKETIIPVEGMVVASASKGYVKYVDKVVESKVDKSLFLSVVASLNDQHGVDLETINAAISKAISDADAANDALEARIKVNEAAISALGKIEGGDGIADALAKKVDKTVYEDKVAELEAADSANTKAVTDEANRATTEEGKLDTAIKAEVSRATTEEGKLDTAIKAEVSRATAKEGELETAISNLSSNLTENYYTIDEVNAKVASVFTWKGGLPEGVAALSGITDAAIGDVYQVNGTEYAYVGKDKGGADIWEELGMNVDMSIYATKEELEVAKTAAQTAANTAKSEAISQAASDAQGKVDALSTALTTEIGKKLATETFNTTIADYAKSADVATDISKAVNAEAERATGIESGLRTDVDAINAKIGEGFSADKTVAGEIAKINEQLGGDGSGNSVADRLEKLEVATAVETTGTADSSIIDNSKVRASYLPNVALKGTQVATGIGQKINFVGNCNVAVDAEGNLTIRIGDNLNSSNFMTTDGQTTGVNDLKVTLPTRTLGLLNSNVAISGVTAGSYTLDTTTAAGLIHIDNPDTTSFILSYKVDGVAKTMEFGPINMRNGDALKTSATFTNNTAKLTVSNFSLETKTAEGATGYCGNIAFDIPVSGLAAAGEIVELTSLTYKNGSEGEFTDKNLGTTNLFYYTDATTKPAVGSVTYDAVTITSEATKSGITYATGGTASVTASELTNMFSPLGVSKNVAFTSNFAADASATTITTSATSNLTLKTCCVDSPTVTATASNINGAGTSFTSANDYEKGLVVYTGSIDASINESGNATQGRITSAGAAWVSANKLSASDLQLFDGKIVYPSKDFSGFNGKNSDRDYSALGSGDKVYYVKLTFSRSTQQPKLTISGSGLNNAALKSVCVANSLSVLDNRDALKTVAQGGVNDGYVTDSATSKVINLSYLGVGETINTAGAYAKIVMSGTGAEITSISLA